MPTCSICYEPFKAPISLPCGHVFCRECIRRTVDSIKSCSVQHWCPTCRVPYSVVTLDPTLIPPYLRPHIQPAIRPILLEDSNTTTSPNAVPSTSTPPCVDASASPQSDLGRAQAELTALRLSCATWRRRAEVHAAANAGLLGFARATKDAAVRMRAERDEARKQCVVLKRKISDTMPISPPASGSGSDSEHEYSAARARRILPSFFRSHHAVEADPEESSCFGPPLKRRRGSTDSNFSSSSSVEFREPPFPGVNIDSPPPVLNALAIPISDVRSSGAGTERKVGRVICSSVSS